MEYLTLPQTDLKVSKIALGCMRIADKSIEEVEELVKTALKEHWSVELIFLIMQIFMVEENQKNYLVKY